MIPRVQKCVVNDQSTRFLSINHTEILYWTAPCLCLSLQARAVPVLSGCTAYPTATRGGQQQQPDTTSTENRFAYASLLSCPNLVPQTASACATPSRMAPYSANHWRSRFETCEEIRSEDGCAAVRAVELVHVVASAISARSDLSAYKSCEPFHDSLFLSRKGNERDFGD